MAYNGYLIIGLSLYLIYYALYKYKNDRLGRTIIFTASILGLIASTSSVLEREFINITDIVRRIVEFPMYIGVSLIIILITLRMWKMRKDPKKKLIAFLWIGMVVLSVILIILVFFLLPLQDL